MMMPSATGSPIVVNDDPIVNSIADSWRDDQASTSSHHVHGSVTEAFSASFFVTITRIVAHQSTKSVAESRARNIVLSVTQ